MQIGIDDLTHFTSFTAAVMHLREQAGLTCNELAARLTTLTADAYYRREWGAAVYTYEQAEDVLAALVPDPSQRDSYRRLPDYPVCPVTSLMSAAYDRLDTPQTQRMHFGECLEALRGLDDQTGRLIASKAGINAGRYFAIERGEAIPDRAEALTIARAVRDVADWETFAREARAARNLLDRRKEEFGPALWTMRHRKSEANRKLLVSGEKLAQAIGCGEAFISDWENQRATPSTTQVRRVICFLRDGTLERATDITADDEAQFYDEAKRVRQQTGEERHRGPVINAEQMRFAEQFRTIITATRLTWPQLDAVLGSTGYRKFLRSCPRKPHDLEPVRSTIFTAFGCATPVEFDQLARAAEHVNTVRDRLPVALEFFLEQRPAGRTEFFEQIGMTSGNANAALSGSSTVRKETLDRIVAGVGQKDEASFFAAAGVPVDREAFARISACCAAILGEPPSGSDPTKWQTKTAPKPGTGRGRK